MAAGKLLHGVDVSARLNTKLAGLFRFSGVFGISVPDNRRELLIIEPGYLDKIAFMLLIPELRQAENDPEWTFAPKTL